MSLKWTSLALILLLGLKATPQEPPADAGQTNESYRLMSDRSIYVAGEQIMIRVFNLNPDLMRDRGWNSVYYLELIAPDGIPCSQVKLPISESGASGSVDIPEDIPSGTYFLKGYTRWMRNTGPMSYQFVSVEVINPGSREVLQVDTTSEHTVKLNRSEPCPVRGETLSSGVASSYSRRESVELNLTRPVGSDTLDCCITVAREGALTGQWESKPVGPEKLDSENYFLPETQGITLTGKVERRDSGEPEPYAVVYLSSLGSGNEFYATHSDSSGRFYFALKEGTGEKEYFISSSTRDQTGLDLRVDQDFSAEPLTLPSFPLSGLLGDPGLVSGLSMNKQIRDQYLEQPAGTDPVAETQERYFYGKPGVIIRFDDFIRLPDLEEYFKEVIPQVSIRRSEGHRYLRVHGDHPDLQFYPPLMMVDGVAIFDAEAILSVAPRYVERVEIIMAPYIRGNVTFGGIIHLITRNGNMGYIDLPSSGLLLHYTKFNENRKVKSLQAPAGPRIPDTRNTLFWEPSVVLEPGEIREISFPAPDQRGNFEILIRGYGPD